MNKEENAMNIEPSSLPRDESGAANDKIGDLRLELPSFWKMDPNTWLIVVETRFRIFRINRQETKYNHVVAAIDLQIAYEVMDIIRR